MNRMPKIYTTYYTSPVGTLKVSCTATYISEVLFLNKDMEITDENQMSQDLPPLLIQCVDELIGYFNGVRRKFEVPVYQEGTPFQMRVWDELQSIPFGKTISYLELSRRLGDIKAIRAAASTNGKNKIAIIVPCHRVIGSNNDLVGYAGGLSNKRWLLQHEAKIAHGVQTLF